jgi:hypothetical protein
VSENRPSIADALRSSVQTIQNDYAEELEGTGLVGDLVLVFETHQSDGRTLMRHVDSNVPSWRQLGMLESAKHTLLTEEIACFMLSVRQERPDDD